jgi:hypothetical protein
LRDTRNTAQTHTNEKNPSLRAEKRHQREKEAADKNRDTPQTPQGEKNEADAEKKHDPHHKTPKNHVFALTQNTKAPKQSPRTETTEPPNHRRHPPPASRCRPAAAQDKAASYRLGALTRAPRCARWALPCAHPRARACARMLVCCLFSFLAHFSGFREHSPSLSPLRVDLVSFMFLFFLFFLARLALRARQVCFFALHDSRFALAKSVSLPCTTRASRSPSLFLYLARLALRARQVCFCSFVFVVQFGERALRARVKTF